ncbi:MAG TPA: TetR/AcrR family transcriptional regulator [Candidatus Acidoferrales bacterium]|nr:TetR/AcrR family transcriptional regulator [Candidatus Acidoferrales bacterium]
MATATAFKVPHLQPSHWIEAGIARLASDGVESVRIELLARDLRVSKGSFYWHFRDREDLLGKILARWEQGERDRLEPSAHAAELRWAWFVEQNSTKERVRMELAIRAWARKDEKVAGCLATADKERTRFVANVLREIGFANTASESWAEVILLVWIGWLDRAPQTANSESTHSGLGDLLSRVILAASGNPAPRIS